MSRRPVPVLRLVLLFAVPLAAIAGAGWWWMSGGRYVSTDNAYVKAHIVQISSEVSGQVRRVLTRDHANVAAGETLLTIESRPFRLALDSADAELDAARAHVESLRGIWREAVAEVAEAESRSAYQERQWQRQEELASKGVASASKRDEAFNEARGAADRVRTAKEKLQRVLTALNGDPQLPADQHPMVREKMAARERAALDLARTAVRAPVDGVVVNMRLQQGEQIKAATPLFALVVLSRPWVEANFKETELTHVRVGQKATVVLDTYPDVTWEALVESVSPATGAEFAILPPQNASGNWVKVVQRLPVKLRLLPHVGEPPLRAGMTATVSIDTGRQRSLTGITRVPAGGKESPPSPPHDVTAQSK
ncbi:HlyD family secretion protein [Reyranella massiliensis]|uniref:HlyD family secretion protein n=1 Tax=Reyranella massiliensis TaxID=445220 RepID=UPI0006886FD4|nr:HlyD family secretion protein [Reyranella massiliensis]